MLRHSRVCTYISKNLRNNCLEQTAGRLLEQQTSIHLPTVSIWTHSTLMHCLLSFSSGSPSFQFENWIIWLNIFVYRDVSVMSCTPIHTPWLKFLKYTNNHLILVRSEYNLLFFCVNSFPTFTKRLSITMKFNTCISSDSRSWFHIINKKHKPNKHTCKEQSWPRK